MDNKIITGEEPAFPIIPFNKDDKTVVETGQLYSGLTIRQEFARAMMQGLLSFQAEKPAEWMANRSVKLADALIAELNRTAP